MQGIKGNLEVAVGVETHKLSICQEDYLQDLLHVFRGIKGIDGYHGEVNGVERGWAVFVV